MGLPAITDADFAQTVASGVTVVDFWGDGKRCELVFGGLKYSTTLDESGIPALSEITRHGLQERIAAVEAAAASSRAKAEGRAS